MSYKGKTVCKPSHLGLELAKDKHASKGMEETSLMDGFTETGSKTSTFDETWKPVWGETATIRNHYNEMEVNLNHQVSDSFAKSQLFRDESACSTNRKSSKRDRRNYCQDGEYKAC